MRLLFIIGCAALALAACNKPDHQPAAPPTDQPGVVDFSAKSVTVGANQILRMGTVAVLIGPATVKSDTADMSVFVLEGQPATAKPAYGLACLAYDAHGLLAGTQSGPVPPKNHGGAMSLPLTRSIVGGKVNCRLTSES